MHTSSSSRIRYLLLPENNSSTSQHITSDERMFLRQRIQLLEMENEDLKRREENVKKINLALSEALGNKEHQPDDIKMLIRQIFEDKTKQGEKETKQLKDQNTQTETIQQTKYPILYEYNHKQLNPEVNPHLNTMKDFRNDYYKQDNQRHSFEYSYNLDTKFNKAKSPQAHNMSFEACLNSHCETPSIKGKRDMSNKKLIKRTISQLEYPVTGRSEKSLSFYGRNVATDLLCDMCGVSFSPIQFLTHVQQCQIDHEQSQQEHQRIRITDADFSQQQDDGSEELVEMLESRKKKLNIQIEKLKKLRSSPDRKRRLQTDLDQIIFIIKNKKTLNTSDIKRLLKEKNYYEKCFR